MWLSTPLTKNQTRHGVKVNQNAKHLSQRSFSSNVTVWTGRYTTCSACSILLVLVRQHSALSAVSWRISTCAVLRTPSSYGDRTFAAAGPRLWNSLPVQLRNPDITYGLFRRQLRGHLFREAQTRRSVTSDMRHIEKHLLTYLVSEWWGAGMVICLDWVADLIWPSWCHWHSLFLASVISRLSWTKGC